METDYEWTNTPEDVEELSAQEFKMRVQQTEQWKEAQLAKKYYVFNRLGDFDWIPKSFLQANICFEQCSWSNFWSIPIDELPALQAINRAYRVIHTLPKQEDASKLLKLRGMLPFTYENKLDNSALTNSMRVHYHQMVFNRLGNRKLSMAKLKDFEEKIDMLSMLTELYQ